MNILNSVDNIESVKFLFDNLDDAIDFTMRNLRIFVGEEPKIDKINVYNAAAKMYSYIKNDLEPVYAKQICDDGNWVITEMFVGKKDGSNKASTTICGKNNNVNFSINNVDVSISNNSVKYAFDKKCETTYAISALLGSMNEYKNCKLCQLETY